MPVSVRITIVYLIFTYCVISQNNFHLWRGEIYITLFACFVGFSCVFPFLHRFLLSSITGNWLNWLWPPVETVFQEQNYSSLHSGRSLAWDHFRSIIGNSCVDWRYCNRRCRSLRNSLNIIKHHETLV